MQKTEGVELAQEDRDFLVELRDSGAINMMGAVPHLQEEFGYSRNEARTKLFMWMSETK